MAKRKNRPQAPEGRNIPLMKGMQELRRSGAAGPHKSATDYRRKPKHPEKGWE